MTVPHNRGTVQNLLDEDRALRNDLAGLDPGYLRELDLVLSWPQERREELSEWLIGRRGQEELATLLAMCEDNLNRLRVRRAIRDVLRA